ncbi:hypothetical protein [Glutamicibacter soli]|uniref:hypothetical protein n=1 Tax=Glutamicibacter soli TaxID=453836 RepID=UPI003FD5441B
MEKNVDVERLNRHLSELAWAPTVEISRAELVAVLSRLEQAEQAVARVRAKHAERVLVYPNGAEEHYCAAEENSAWPCDTIRALDGDGCRLADDALGGDNNG